MVSFQYEKILITSKGRKKYPEPIPISIFLLKFVSVKAVTHQIFSKLNFLSTHAPP